jgi:S-(hydroxymethyl)glutathione dehydrogenase/alcohol dehydrogenase
VTQAAVLREAGVPLRVETIDLPEPGAHQVHVRMTAAGVCHSDLSLARGVMTQQTPAVLGHEGCGTVVAVGEEVTTPRPGDTVVLCWLPPCGRCWFCAHGEPYLCAHAGDAAGRPYAALADGTEVYPCLGVGAFATDTVVDANACVTIPADLPADQAALLGCAVLTGVGAVLNAAHVRPGESIVVIGLGGVGLCAVQGARVAGADPIIAVDVSPAKADLARQLGATHVLDGADFVKQVRALTDGRGADHAIECVGRADTIRAAWSATRRGGHTTVVGMGARADELTLNAIEIAYFARTLSGCMFGSSDVSRDIPLLVDHVRAGRIDLEALVTDRIGLDGIDAAFDAMAAGRGVRSVVIFPQ